MAFFGSDSLKDAYFLYPHPRVIALISSMRSLSASHQLHEVDDREVGSGVQWRRKTKILGIVVEGA